MSNATTYHVLFADDGTVLALFRHRVESDGLYLEAYRNGEGWVRDSGAAEVYRNGQDYDLIDAARAEALIADMKAGER